MNQYLKEYKKINEHFGIIMEESLKGKNLMTHAKATNFIEDYEMWISLLKDSYEIVIYKEAISEYRAMLLFWNMGLYKYSFMALRGYFELTLFGIQLSTNELSYRLWKQSELDLYWTQISDETSGIFGQKFIRAFQPGLAEEAKTMNKIAKSVYRECSEFIHSNYSTTNFLPDSTIFSQELFDNIAQKVETINQVVTYMFVVRYYENVIKKGKRDEFENCIMDNIGYIPCINDMYK